MKCGNCEGRIRRGTGRRAFILGLDGPKAAIVCATCAAHGTLFVVSAPIVLRPPCAACKKAGAAICDACAQRLGDNVRELSACNIARIAVVPS
jgi:hypothetical protein